MSQHCATFKKDQQTSRKIAKICFSLLHFMNFKGQSNRVESVQNAFNLMPVWCIMNFIQTSLTKRSFPLSEAKLVPLLPSSKSRYLHFVRAQEEQRAQLQASVRLIETEFERGKGGHLINNLKRFSQWILITILIYFRLIFLVHSKRQNIRRLSEIKDDKKLFVVDLFVEQR